MLRELIVAERHPRMGDERARALWDRMSELTQNAAHGVDTSRTIGDVGRAQAMQRRERLLFDRLDRHGIDRLVATRLQERDRIGAVRLVAVPIARDVARRQQPHAMAECLELAPPVVRRAARFHQHIRTLVLSEEATEALA
jgi:hypothetical protein